MKIAYLTSHFDFGNYRNRGVGYYICESLRGTGIGVEQIGFVDEPMKKYYWLKSKIHEKLSGQHHLRHREPGLHARTGRLLSKIVENTDCDAVFAFGSLPVTYLKTDKPVVIWTDATFAGLLDYYDEYTHLTKQSIRNGNAMDQRAFDTASHIIFSSDWALQTAADNYRIDKNKMSMITFGANFDYNFSDADVEEFIAKRSTTECRLIANGRFWLRKGIDKAVEIARCLHRRGYKVHLDVIGCSHELDTEAAQFVTMHGLIDKNIPANQEKIARMFEQAHFHILMSRYECCAHALMEAAAFGIPSVSSRTGGIPTAVIDGTNGCLFAPDAPATEAADYISKFNDSPELYRELARRTYRHYTENQSWQVSAKKVKTIIENLISEKKR